MKRKLEDSEFDSFVGRFSSMPLARIWFGDYLALYLELGRLIGNYKNSGRSKHERHIFAGYDWTLTDSDAKTIPRSELTEAYVLQMLDCSRIRSVTLDVANELMVRFTNGCHIQTLGTDLPEWSLHETPDKYVSFENGWATLETDTVH